jgi:hypothetical protein
MKMMKSKTKSVIDFVAAPRSHSASRSVLGGDVWVEGVDVNELKIKTNK